MPSTDEWDGGREQITAEWEGGFDGGYSDWVAQWDGVHEQITAEWEAGAGPFKPEYELLPAWDAELRRFVWAIRAVVLDGQPRKVT
jgi:hypothetical protein